MLLPSLISPCALPALALALAVLITLTLAHPPGGKTYGDTGHALYLITNEAVNKVVPIPIGADGLLSGEAAVNTGGAGANSLTGLLEQPSAPDALFSQSALTLAGQVSHTKQRKTS